MNEKNIAKNAVEFIWHAKITKDYYEKSSLRTIYNWILGIAKSECKKKGQQIVNDEVKISLDFTLEEEMIFITVTQKVFID